MATAIPYVDLLTGDRVSVTLEVAKDGTSLRVYVRLALSAAAVDAAARALGFKSAAQSKSLSQAWKVAHDTEHADRMQLARARLQNVCCVHLMSEIPGIASLRGTLSLSSTYMKRTGRRGSQRSRRRVGRDTTMAQGFLRVEQVDDNDDT